MIGTAQLRARLVAADRPQLILQRPIDAPVSGHLPGSLVLDRGDLGVALRILTRDEPIVVYGSRPRCAESRLLALALEADGFSQVAWYAGGLDTWEAAGLAVEGAS